MRQLSRVHNMGNLLRQQRIRMGLSQESLAETIGTSSRSVRRWEMNLALPQEFYRERLHQLLGIDLQPRDVPVDVINKEDSALSPLWYLPFYRNPFFTGHGTTLETLHMRLHIEQEKALRQSYALNGLPGIGKTQLAVEYAYRYANEYQAVFWIAAENNELTVASFLQIADVLNLPERNKADQVTIIKAVQRWLVAHTQWLLIWDNLEDLDLLQSFLPSTREGSILITTRFQALGPLAYNLELAPLTPEEGAKLLLRRSKMVFMSEGIQGSSVSPEEAHVEFPSARVLAEMMGGLPLALDQAGAYIEEIGCSIQDYIQRYQQQQIQLLDRRGTTSKDHPASVLATFSLARRNLEKEHHLAAELLKACAFLHTEAIPEEIFGTIISLLDPSERGCCPDAHLSLSDAALAALRGFSLIQRYLQTHTFSIHRLVQLILQKSLDEQESVLWQTRTIRALNMLFPESTQENWDTCERLLPHVSACASSIPEHMCNEDLAEALRKAADYFRVRAQYAQAEKFYKRACDNWQRMSQEAGMGMSKTLSGLAQLLVEQGKYEEAKPLFQQALHIIEQNEGQNHQSIVGPLNGLALLYYYQGRHSQARDTWQQALKIMEQTLGPTHLQAARFLNNLAHFYTSEGQYEEAEELLQRALCIRGPALPPAHLQIASILSNLAQLHYKRRNYGEAEKFCLQALTIREQVLGSRHPIVAYSLMTLGDIYKCYGRYEEAERFYLRGLSIRESLLDAQHPFIANSLACLATLYYESGKYEQAIRFYERALAIRKRRLGRQQLEAAQTQYELATRLLRQQCFAEAADVFRCLYSTLEPGYIL